MKPNEFNNISSLKIRNLAENLKIEELYNYVPPLVISELLEKALKINNLFMVVGRPGTGKSTFLKILSKENKKNIHIDTDELNKKLKPLIQKNFHNEDLINVAVNRSEELKALITKPWLNLLKKKLKQVPRDSNVFVEIPYGLQLDKKMFRFVGGKIIHVTCRKETAQKRIKEKGDSKLLPFMEKIPDLRQTKKIVKENRLSLISIENNGTIEELKKKARKFNGYLNKKGVARETGAFWINY